MSELNGNYRGKVIDNSGTLGRCKIYVPSVHPVELNGVGIDNVEKYADQLPWSEPAMPIFGGNTDNQGMCSWPSNDSIVWLFFEGCNITKPVYFASTQGGDAWVSENNKQYVIRTEKYKLTIDDDDETLALSLNGDMANKITGDQTESIGGDYSLNITGSLNVTATGNITFNGKTINFNQ